MMERKAAEKERRVTETDRNKAKECRVSSEKLKSEANGFGHGRCQSVNNSETAYVKLLRKQLKLEKKRVKHDKRVAQLEKAEKNLIGQHVNLLKQESIQLSCRLNMLDYRLSYSTEGKEGLTKMEESPEVPGFNLQNKFFGTRPCDFNSPSDLGMIKSYYNDSSNCSYPMKECTDLHLSGGSITRPMSGISSDLESLIRHSVRNKSQSSAVCSNSTNFSDRTFMGSQERDDLFISTSAKLRGSSFNRRSTVPELAGELGKHGQNENSGFVTEKTDRSYCQRDVGRVYLNSSIHDGTEIAGVSGHSSKKRRIQETLESIALLRSESYQLRLKMGEKLSALKEVLSIKDGLPMAIRSDNCETLNRLDDGRGLLTEKNGDMYSLYHQRDTDAEVPKQRKLNSQPCGQNDSRYLICLSGSEGIRKPCLTSETAAPNSQMLEHVNICREESVDTISSDRAAVLCFDNFVYGDCLKFLELDNKDDERRYRTAMEMPLSPSLPEINSPRVQHYGEDESLYLVEGLPRWSESERDNSVSFDTLDVIDLEIKSNMVKLKVSNNLELASDNNIGFSHSPEGPKHSALLALHSGCNQNSMVRDFELNSYIGNSRFLDVEMCDARDSSNLMNHADPESYMRLRGPYCQAKSPVECPFDPNTNHNSNVSDDSVSRDTDRFFSSHNAGHRFSNSTVHSKLLHEERCAQSDNQEICNLARSTFPVANVLEKTFETDQVPSLSLFKSQIEGEIDYGTRKLTNGNGFLAAGQAAQTSIHLVLESNAIIEAAKKMALSTSGELKNPHRSNDELERTPKYCVIFSNTKDEDNRSRIICATNNIIQNFMLQADTDIAEVLHALAAIPDLLPEDKVSVFFSSVLYNLSGAALANSKGVMNGDILRCSQSFELKIDRVISDGETRWLFQEICQLDILLNLIEDFLIGRNFLMYDDVSSSKFHRLEEGNVCLCYRTATDDQLVAASIILGCICVAVNHIGFLLEASYKILRRCRNDTSRILLVLHVFASVTGKKFFTLDNYSFLIAAIRSMVSLLERGNESPSSASPCHSACDLGPSFPPCERCPFYTNTITVDKFTTLLLDVLHDYASGIGHPNLNKSVVSSKHKVTEYVERDEESFDRDLDVVSIECDAACMLLKYKKHAMDKADCICERSFCHYTDIISLVELVGCYMSWEWTSNNVMSRLLEMLESCTSEEFAAALFVLIGQLARFGIDVGGYQQTGVSKLARSLSMFVDPSLTRKGSFPTQFAAVGALLNILPSSFGEIVDGYLEHSLDGSQSLHAELIKKWFSQLNRELQSLSLCLFSDTDVQKF